MSSRNLFDEVSRFLVVLDPEADDLFEILGDKDLAILAVFSLNKIERDMLFALGTTAVGLAACPGAHRQRSSDETRVIEELSQPGAAIPLSLAHFGSRNLAFFFWHIIVISDSRIKSRILSNANLLRISQEAKVLERNQLSAVPQPPLRNRW